MRAIVAVTDLTGGSDGALRTAGRMAARTGAALHVVHGAGLLGLSLREAFPLLQVACPETLLERMGQQLRRTVPAPLADRARRHLGYGPAHQAARERARAVSARVVVAGAQAMDGDALSALVLETDAAVLVVRDGQAPPFARVLVPVADEDIAGGTLGDACAWLRPLERDGALLSDVHVLHVCRRLADWRGIGARFEAQVRAVEHEARRMAGVFHRHVRWSAAPWPAIVQATAEVAADLVVLRPRRDAPGGADRTWMRVAAHARCDVLLLPPATGERPRRTEAEEQGRRGGVVDEGPDGEREAGMAEATAGGLAPWGTG